MLDTDPIAMQQIDFTWNLNRGHWIQQCFSLLKKQRFFTKNFESIVTLFCFNIISI